MSRSAPWQLSAAEQAALIRSRELSPVDLLESVLERIAQQNPALGAYCTLAEDQARATAQQAEAALATSQPLGPLHGVPVSVKDLIDTAGIRTTYGSLAYRDRVPEADDVVVERLRAAGAVIVGKTNTSEFGYMAACHNQLFPTTRNPWNLERTPGGSSGGAAAAVSAGLGSIAIGSDGGGSIRLPAALCGLVGFKPSFGVVPSYPGCRDPSLPGASSWELLEVLGPLARTVEDIALVMQAIAGPDPRDRHSLPSLGGDWTTCLAEDVRGMRIAWTVDFGGQVTVEPEVRSTFESALPAFEALGCTLEEATPEIPDLDETFLSLIVRDSDLVGLRQLVEEVGESNVLPDLLGVLKLPVTAEALTTAAMMQQRISNELARFMSRYDLLLTPTVPCRAFELDVASPTRIAGREVSPTHFLSLVRVFNMTYQPAISVPAGWSQGLPVGLQIVGRRLDDARLLAAAAAYEQVRPWHDQWPEDTARG